MKVKKVQTYFPHFEIRNAQGCACLESFTRYMFNISYSVLNCSSISKFDTTNVFYACLESFTRYKVKR